MFLCCSAFQIVWIFVWYSIMNNVFSESHFIGMLFFKSEIFIEFFIIKVIFLINGRIFGTMVLFSLPLDYSRKITENEFQSQNIHELIALSRYLKMYSRHLGIVSVEAFLSLQTFRERPIALQTLLLVTVTLLASRWQVSTYLPSESQLYLIVRACIGTQRAPPSRGEKKLRLLINSLTRKAIQLPIPMAENFYIILKVLM